MRFRDKIARAVLLFAVMIASERYLGRMVYAIRNSPMDKDARDLVDRSMRPE